MIIRGLRGRTPARRRLALPRENSNYMRTSVLRICTPLSQQRFGALEFANTGLVPSGCPALSALLACPHHAGSASAQRILEHPEAPPLGNARRFAPVRER